MTEVCVIFSTFLNTSPQGPGSKFRTPAADRSQLLLFPISCETYVVLSEILLPQTRLQIYEETPISSPKTLLWNVQFHFDTPPGDRIGKHKRKQRQFGEGVGIFVVHPRGRRERDPSHIQDVQRAILYHACAKIANTYLA